MASFDIVEAAGRGYRFAWAERAYLFRCAFIPIIIKMVCHTLVVTLGWDDDFIRQALVMLPSYFADGWMLAWVVRLIFFDDRLPLKKGDEENRALVLGIGRGTVSFVVIKFLLAGFVAVIHRFVEENKAMMEGDNVNMGWYIASLAIMMVMVWGFRYLWLYIPAALNYPLRPFVLALGGLRTSFYLIGTWLICMAPVLFAFAMIAVMMVSSVDGSVTGAMNFAINFIHVVLDTVINILATAGIAFGFMAMGSAKKT